jgi:hypothetical protein
MKDMAGHFDQLVSQAIDNYSILLVCKEVIDSVPSDSPASAKARAKLEETAHEFAQYVHLSSSANYSLTRLPAS